MIAVAVTSWSAHAERMGNATSSGFFFDETAKPTPRPPLIPMPPVVAPEPELEGVRPFNYAANGRGNLVTVQGCNPNSGFTVKYGTPTLKGRQCDRTLSMHKGLAEFFNKHLNVCLDKAANNAFGHATLTADLNGRDNTIFHDGCIGNAEHQEGGSWHNEGLALDVKAFKVGGRLLKYSDALDTKTANGRKTASFFHHLRKCWGEAVAANGSSCRKTGKEGQPAGTIGNEHHKHHHHLHLSLPCKNLSDGRATNTAGIWQLFEGVLSPMHARAKC